VSLQWSPPSESSDTAQGFLTHRVRSGDTLSSIARRYLGSSERYREIYLANREVLGNPDRLVAGTELKIPMSGNEPPPAPAPPPPLPKAMYNVSAADTMVPIPQGTWRRSDPARLAQRIYAVRANDTLAGIALQFYGDARRYNELFEANRHQMRWPDDMHEGMILVIP
jgi:nucleoid-associated protein YgaU